MQLGNGMRILAAIYLFKLLIPIGTLLPGNIFHTNSRGKIYKVQFGLSHNIGDLIPREDTLYIRFKKSLYPSLQHEALGDVTLGPKNRIDYVKPEYYLPVYGYQLHIA